MRCWIESLDNQTGHKEILCYFDDLIEAQEYCDEIHDTSTDEDQNRYTLTAQFGLARGEAHNDNVSFEERFRRENQRLAFQRGSVGNYQPEQFLAMLRENLQHRNITRSQYEIIHSSSVPTVEFLNSLRRAMTNREINQ